MMDNKKLIDRLARNLKRDRADVTKLLDAFTGAVSDRCGEMDSIAIPGFGTFEPHKRNEHVVADPDSGKRMLVPPEITLEFRLSNVLKKKLHEH